MIGMGYTTFIRKWQTVESIPDQTELPKPMKGLNPLRWHKEDIEAWISSKR